MEIYRDEGNLYEFESSAELSLDLFDCSSC